MKPSDIIKAIKQLFSENFPNVPFSVRSLAAQNVQADIDHGLYTLFATLLIDRIRFSYNPLSNFPIYTTSVDVLLSFIAGNDGELSLPNDTDEQLVTETLNTLLDTATDLTNAANKITNFKLMQVQTENAVSYFDSNDMSIRLTFTLQSTVCTR